MHDPSHPAAGDRGLARDAAQAPARSADPVRICPNCGATLDDRSCKLTCPTPGCGYYLSCSDFY